MAGEGEGALKQRRTGSCTIEFTGEAVNGRIEGKANRTRELFHAGKSASWRGGAKCQAANATRSEHGPRARSLVVLSLRVVSTAMWRSVSGRHVCHHATCSSDVCSAASAVGRVGTRSAPRAMSRAMGDERLRRACAVGAHAWRTSRPARKTPRATRALALCLRGDDCARQRTPVFLAPNQLFRALSAILRILPASFTLACAREARPDASSHEAASYYETRLKAKHIAANWGLMILKETDEHKLVNSESTGLIEMVVGAKPKLRVKKYGSGLNPTIQTHEDGKEVKV
ncbi:hypothetical protein FGB62_46g14 [Gracilaria domingensis]|nr:hypothetical protein FGB62_46g14 [Gracilaria domingensis]